MKVKLDPTPLGAGPAILHLTATTVAEGVEIGRLMAAAGEAGAALGDCGQQPDGTFTARFWLMQMKERTRAD